MRLNYNLGPYAQNGNDVGFDVGASNLLLRLDWLGSGCATNIVGLCLGSFGR